MVAPYFHGETGHPGAPGRSGWAPFMGGWERWAGKGFSGRWSSACECSEEGASEVIGNWGPEMRLHRICQEIQTLLSATENVICKVGLLVVSVCLSAFFKYL